MKSNDLMRPAIQWLQWLRNRPPGPSRLKAERHRRFLEEAMKTAAMGEIPNLKKLQEAASNLEAFSERDGVLDALERAWAEKAQVGEYDREVVVASQGQLEKLRIERDWSRLSQLQEISFQAKSPESKSSRSQS